MHQDRNVLISADFNVTLHDVVVRSVVDSAGFKEQTKHTRATEMFGADSKKKFPSESMWVCLLSEHPAVELRSVS